jgi:uncharacterized protein
MPVNSLESRWSLSRILMRDRNDNRISNSDAYFWSLRIFPNMIAIIKTKIAHWVKRILAEDASPEKIARGAALGVFLAVLPILGIQSVFAISLAVFFRINRIACLSFTGVNNPLTMVFIYGFNFYIGSLIFPVNVTLENFKTIARNLEWNSLVKLGHEIIVPLAAGSLIVAVFAAIGTYGAAKIACRIYFAQKPVS